MLKNGANQSNAQKTRDFVFVDIEKEIADHSNIVGKSYIEGLGIFMGGCGFVSLY
ncbi:hypothetical protein [Desulfoluna spongiiphila]|uniref:hypothetical protein n=1 Tax=Desulfoluna spongiiphila TaxID=419481 RepID=UPI0018697ADE|nr:hypothetical protein [Desulfoluna spongiiphila]